MKSILMPGIRYHRHKVPYSLEKLGSVYGGWIIPVDILHERSVCYLAGAGEDISFDTALAKRFGCNVDIFDPTPRAKIHFDRVMEAAHTMQPLLITAKEKYDLDPVSVGRLRFHPIGIWKQPDILKFFAPKDETHVSHSISNLQNTGAYFEACVEKLSDIMRSNGQDRIDLLKLDIEGAEFEVIDSFLTDKIEIKILCVEFHISEKNGKSRLQSIVKKLEQNGFAVVAKENLDFTFINKKYSGN